MGTGIVLIAVAIICIALGVSNMKGNISSIHSYHRSRVSEEDRIPFGRLVGIGMIIIGISIFLLFVGISLTVYFEEDIYSVIGTVVMIVGLAVGLGFSFYAMKKYNGGIF